MARQYVWGPVTALGLTVAMAACFIDQLTKLWLLGPFDLGSRGAVHLALLSTGEDRAKAVMDWTWAGFTHERSGRITVKT